MPESWATADYLEVGAVADSYRGFDEPGSRFNSLAHLEWVAYCAQAFGFSTTISTVPGSPPELLADVNREQLDRWAQVDQGCTAEAVRRGWVVPQPQTPEERRAEYQHLLKVNECLTDIGYGTQPPSEESFVEGAEWNVYGNTPFRGELGIMPTAEGETFPPEIRQQLEIQQRCPAW